MPSDQIVDIICSISAVHMTTLLHSAVSVWVLFNVLLNLSH